jgi:hypothetical protein
MKDLIVLKKMPKQRQKNIQGFGANLNVVTRKSRAFLIILLFIITSKERF